MNPFTPEQKKKSEPQADIKPTVILTQTDSYLYERVKAQPPTLDEVSVIVEERRRPNEHRLSLPKELEPHEKKFAFRWLFKNKKAIDEACDQKGWFLCNKTYFPDLPNYLFSGVGCIERGDNILAFMPVEKAKALREAPGKQSREIVKAQFEKHKDDPRFYIPKDDDDDRVIGI